MKGPHAEGLVFDACAGWGGAGFEEDDFGDLERHVLARDHRGLGAELLRQ